MKILLIDDHAAQFLPILKQKLGARNNRAGYEFIAATSTSEGWDALSEHTFDLVLLDLHFPEDDQRTDGRTSGDLMLPEIRQRYPALPIMVLTTRLDALDIPFIPLLAEHDALISKPEWASEPDWPLQWRDRIERVIAEKNQVIDLDVGFVIGKTVAMAAVGRKIAAASKLAMPVLITGETGTGKQLVARALHKLSGRKGSFEHLDCGAVNAETLESDLFGHEKGAYTGAVAARKGRFELAEGGTLFLDEAQSMPMALQHKLMVALQERKIRKMGSERDVSVNVRVISAFNEKLSVLVRAKTFREDLAYRLACHSIDLPPLRERLVDLDALVTLFINETNRLEGTAWRTLLRPETREKLASHTWPGNLRELQRTIQSACTSGIHADVLLPEYLQFLSVSPESTRSGRVEASRAQPQEPENSEPQEITETVDFVQVAMRRIEIAGECDRWRIFLEDTAKSDQKAVLEQIVAKLGVAGRVRSKKLTKYLGAPTDEAMRRKSADLDVSLDEENEKRLNSNKVRS